jgi:peptide/nickel transport system substrate-binding protein
LDPSSPNPFDPQKARVLLASAGYGPKNPLRITLETNPSYADMAQFLQSQWAPMGVMVDLRLSQGPALRQMISGKEAGFFRASWIADYADAENYLALAYGPHRVPNGPNYTCYQNRDFDRWYLEALQTTDNEKRILLYRRMDAQIREAQPLVVLYYDMMLQLLGNSWTGYRVSPLNIPDFRYLRRVPTSS